MAISFVSSSNTTYVSRTNTTVIAPSGIQNDDLLLLTQITALGPTEAPDPTQPSGFTIIGAAIDIFVNSFNLEMRCYYKRASSESGDYTSTHTACSSQGHMQVYRGVDWSTGPFDATQTVNNGSGSTRVWTGLTTVTASAWIVAIGSDWADFTNNLTPPTGMTERLEVNGLSYVATEEIVTPAATGTRTNACNNTNNVGSLWGARMIALRPAGVAAPSVRAATRIASAQQAVHQASAW